MSQAHSFPHVGSAVHHAQNPATAALSVAETARRLKRLRRLTRLLDDAVRIPGTKYRLGLDSLIGLVPGAGDIVGGALSAYIIYEASRLGVSRLTLARMLSNLAVDLLLGSVPVAGDIFDVAWKANRKNMDLLDRHLGPKP